MLDSRIIEHRRGGIKGGGGQPSCPSEAGASLNNGAGNRHSVDMKARGSQFVGVVILAALMIIFAASSLAVGSLLGEDDGGQRQRGNAEDEVASFRKHIEGVEKLIHVVHGKFLAPWKVSLAAKRYRNGESSSRILYTTWASSDSPIYILTRPKTVATGESERLCWDQRRWIRGDEHASDIAAEGGQLRSDAGKSTRMVQAVEASEKRVSEGCTQLEVESLGRLHPP